MPGNPSSTQQARRVLGLDEHTGHDEARRRYVDLARQNHPDRFMSAPVAEQSAAEKRMQQINEAWRQVSAQPEAAAKPRVASGAPQAPPFPEAESYQPGMPPLIKYGPWAFLMVMLAVIFVATAFAGSGLGGSGDDAPASVNAGAAGTASVGGAVASPPAGDAASPAAQAAIGQCVEVRDDVVLAYVACTPQASGTLEAAADRTGACFPGSAPVLHRDLDIGMCLRPWGSS